MLLQSCRLDQGLAPALGTAPLPAALFPAPSHGGGSLRVCSPFLSNTCSPVMAKEQYLLEKNRTDFRKPRVKAPSALGRELGLVTVQEHLVNRRCLLPTPQAHP